MKNIPLIEKLEKEKEKLAKLSNEAMRKGIPLTQDKEFMAQNQKVDVLVVKIQKKYIYKPTKVIPNNLM
jgi:hypothetical protein